MKNAFREFWKGSSVKKTHADSINAGMSIVALQAKKIQAIQRDDWKEVARLEREIDLLDKQPTKKAIVKSGDISRQNREVLKHILSFQKAKTGGYQGVITNDNVWNKKAGGAEVSVSEVQYGSSLSGKVAYNAYLFDGVIKQEMGFLDKNEAIAYAKQLFQSISKSSINKAADVSSIRTHVANLMEDERLGETKAFEYLKELFNDGEIDRKIYENLMYDFGIKKSSITKESDDFFTGFCDVCGRKKKLKKVVLSDESGYGEYCDDCIRNNPHVKVMGKSVVKATAADAQKIQDQIDKLSKDFDKYNDAGDQKAADRVWNEIKGLEKKLESLQIDKIAEYYCSRCGEEVNDVDDEGYCEDCNPDAFKSNKEERKMYHYTAVVLESMKKPKEVSGDIEAPDDSEAKELALAALARKFGRAEIDKLNITYLP